MKNLFFTVVVVLILGLISCGKTAGDVPVKVKSAFAEKYPGAKDVDWDMEEEGEWEAEFEINEQEMSANFTSDGAWKESEYTIEESELPSAVKDTLNTKFSGFDIEKAEISETMDGRFYEIQMEKEENEMGITIDSQGNVIIKSLDEQDEEAEESEEEHE